MEGGGDQLTGRYELERRMRPPARSGGGGALLPTDLRPPRKKAELFTQFQIKTTPISLKTLSFRYTIFVQLIKKKRIFSSVLFHGQFV